MFSQLLRSFEVADLEEQMKGLERDRGLTEPENGSNGNGGGAGRDSKPAPKGDGANGNGSLQPANQGREEIRGTRSLPTKAIKAY
jgi:hypothetical protein